MTLLMLEEEGSMTGRHPQDEADTVGRALEIEDPVRALEIEGERTLTGHKIGNQFHHPSRRVPCQIQPILLVMYQQCTINIRYKDPYGTGIGFTRRGRT